MGMYALENDSTGLIETQVGQLAPVEVGPPLPPPVIPGYTAHLLSQPLPWGGRPSEAHALKWNDGDPVWVATSGAATVLLQVIAAIDAAGDAARLLAIGDPARALEYQQAEQQAREYRAREYAGDAPDDVASWSEPKGWTGQQAADDIIATADRWRSALSAIRKLRLAAKESARAIAADPTGTAAQLYAVQKQFTVDLGILMAGIQ